MNSTLEILDRRRSVRAYANRPIDAAEKDAIVQAAFRAPTAGNMMLYSIIEVDDPELRARLVVTCDNQPFIARAPLVLLFLADCQRWADYFELSGCEPRALELGLKPRKPQVGDLMLACCDTLIAAQNAVIAAESLGIGSCYIGDILENYEIHRQMFNLPRYVIPLTMLCFGYPADNPDRVRSTRFNRKYILSQNAYHRLGADEIREMFSGPEERFAERGPRQNGAQNFGQAMYFRKFISEFSVEMSRSVQAMLDQWSQE